MDNASFNDWFVSRLQQIRNVLAFGGILAFLLAGTTGILDFGKITAALPSLANLLLTLVLLLILARAKDKDDEDPLETEKAAAAKRQFISCWTYCWLMWFVLYAAMTIRSAVPDWWPHDARAQVTATIIINGLNTVHSGYLLMAFYILSKPRDAALFSNWYWILWVVCVILFSLCAVISLIGRTSHASSLILLSTLVSSIAGAVALIALVGRIESKLINLPNWCILLLYGYGAIQPLFWTFDLRHVGLFASEPTGTGFDIIQAISALEHVAVVAAFCLKLLLFAAVYWFLFRGPSNTYFAETAGETLDLEPRALAEPPPRTPITKSKYPRMAFDYVAAASDSRIGEIAALMATRLTSGESMSERLLRQIVGEASVCDFVKGEPTVERFAYLGDKEGILGFMYTIYCRRHRLLFLPYLITIDSRDPAIRSRKLSADKDKRCSRVLIDECFSFQKQYFPECVGVLLELDHPSAGSNDKEVAERKARIVLFRSLARKCGIELRIIDMPYTQPPIGDQDVPAPASNPSLLLMYGSLNREVLNDRKRHLTFDEIDYLLSMICESVYGRVYRDNPPRRRERIGDLLAWRQQILLRIPLPTVGLVDSYDEVTSR